MDDLIINLLVGNDGDDTLDGGSGDDLLQGGAGDDTLSGGNGDDLLQGGAGDDTLSGSNGDDLLNGASGDDTFIDVTGIDTSGIDTLIGGIRDDILVLEPGTITDFELDKDVIGVGGLTFDGLSFDGNNIFEGETLATITGIDVMSLTTVDLQRLE